MAGIVTGQTGHGRTNGKMSGYPQPDIKPDNRGFPPLGGTPLSGLSDRATFLGTIESMNAKEKAP